MQPKGLSDLAANGEHSVEACHRFLEDHADVVAANVPHRPLRKSQKIDALKTDGTRDLARRLRNQAQDEVRDDRLSAAAFADDRQRLMGVDERPHLALKGHRKELIDPLIAAGHDAAGKRPDIDLNWKRGRETLRYCSIVEPIALTTSAA
jgi:hypothetical protein